jgi:putative protease
MAAVKKRKARVKAKKSPAKKKSPIRKKKAPRKAPARKPAARRAAPKKKAAARAPARPRPAPAPEVPPRGPLPGEVRVGVVSHYYGHLQVAAVKLEVALAVGDTIRVLGHTSDFRQKVESMQIEHQAVSEAIAGDEIGLRVVQHAREHDVVYRVPA